MNFNEIFDYVNRNSINSMEIDPYWDIISVLTQESSPTPFLDKIKTILKEDKPKIGGRFNIVEVGNNGRTNTTELYITKVIYNNPATIVFFSDGSKTTSKCSADDIYNAENGLMLCVMKRLYGGEHTAQLLKDWAPSNNNGIRTLNDIRKEYKKNNAK